MQPLGEGVDGEDAAEVQGIGGEGILDAASGLEEFGIGVVHLAGGAEALHFADEHRPPAGGEAVLHPVPAVVEPLEDHLTGAVADHHLIELLTAAAGERFAGGEDLAAEHLPLAVAQLGDAADLAAVFVAVRQGVEGVFDGGEAEAGEFFLEAGPTPRICSRGVASSCRLRW